MDYTFIVLLSIVLLILGIVGTILPILPGLVLRLAGLLIYKYGAEADLSMIYIWAFVILTVASVILATQFPQKRLKNTEEHVGEVLVQL